MFSMSKTPLDSAALGAALADSRAGALATFEGWVRNHNEGSSVTALEYECYEALAEKEGAKIIAEAKSKFDIVDAACRHRVGMLPVGELAVWVGVTSVHRADAFDACRFVIDEIKSRLPIWKKEHYTNGTTGWVNCSEHEHNRGKRTCDNGDSSAKHEHTESDMSSKTELSETKFYSRQVLVQEIGTKGQETLKRSRVLVVGAGGTGCPALQYLTGAGVGTIGICDFDTVDISNLHRQPLYTIQDTGKSKAKAAAERLAASNPFIKLVAIAEKFDNDSASRLIADYDMVLDCTDNLSAKFSIADACHEFRKTLLQASVHGFDGQLMMWQPLDVDKNSGISSGISSGVNSDADAQKTYKGQCYRCLWPSKELLQPGGIDCIDNCAQSGVLGAVPGLLGTMQATETIKALLGLPTPLTDNVILFDLLACTTTKIKVRSLAECSACGGQQKRTVSGDRTSQLENISEKNQFNSQKDEWPDESEFELHWNVLRSRSPRELVYVDIRSEREREGDATTSSKLKGRPLQNWPLQEIDIPNLKLDRNLTYLFICQRGKRSAKLVYELRKLGHRNVFSLSEGAESISGQPSEHARI